MREIREECTDCVCNGCEYAECCKTDYPMTHSMSKGLERQSDKDCPIYRLYQLDAFNKELQNPKLEFLHE